MNPRLISVVLPVHNQAGHIREVLDEYIDALAELPFPFELIAVVNGARRDNTLEICQEFATRGPQVRLVCIEEGGWGRAVRTGLAETRGDLICYTNSARTTGKDLVLMLLYAVANPGSVVKANRKIRASWFRRLGSLVYNLECRALFNLAYWDINGTPKVFPRTFPALMGLRRNDDLIDLEFHIRCRLGGYPVLEVPIFSSARHSGRSTTNLVSAIRMYAGAIALRRDMGAS